MSSSAWRERKFRRWLNLVGCPLVVEDMWDGKGRGYFYMEMYRLHSTGIPFRMGRNNTETVVKMVEEKAGNPVSYTLWFFYQKVVK